MANYANTKILDLTPDAKNSLEAIFASGKYHIRNISACKTTFSASEETAEEILIELSSWYPQAIITTDSRYESYHYNGVFTERYQNGGKLAKVHVRIQYEYNWPQIKLDEEIKREFEEQMEDYFLGIDVLAADSKLILNVHEDEEIIAAFNIDNVRIQATKTGEMIEISIIEVN